MHFNFKITQNMREVRLFNLINKWLGCGHVQEFPKEARVNLVITSLKDIVEILIPILNKYNLQGINKLNFDGFMAIVKLVENEEHLSQEGLEKIRQIKSEISTGRRAIYLNRREDDENTNISTDLHPLGITKGSPRIKKEVVKGFLIQKREFHLNRIRANTRIGPHNLDVCSVLFGSLLGDAYANKRSVEGTRICYRQSSINKEYLFSLYTFFYSRGYCSNLEPRMYTRKLRHNGAEIIHYGFEFNTFTFRSFN